MRLAIISDTHDNIPNLEKAIAWMNKNGIAAIIHCGDLCAPATLKNVLAPQFQKPIHMVFGNVEDRDLLPSVVKEFPHVRHYGDVADFAIDGKRMAVNHYPNTAKELARTGKFDYSFYGHTHTPWEEEINGCRVVNPGTLAGLFSKATFAMLDTVTGVLELKLVEQL